MTDPTSFGGGLSPGQLAADLAAKQAAAPSGVTDVDPQALLAAIAQLQEQMAALQAEKAASGKAPLLAYAEQLVDFVAHNHADTPGHQLALDLRDAAGNAVTSGGLSQVEKLVPKLSRWLHRNAPAPGENWHYANAVQVTDFHLPDAIDSFTPPPAPLAPLSGGAPVKVVSGSVTG